MELTFTNAWLTHNNLHDEVENWNPSQLKSSPNFSAKKKRSHHLINTAYFTTDSLYITIQWHINILLNTFVLFYLLHQRHPIKPPTNFQIIHFTSKQFQICDNNLVLLEEKDITRNSSYKWNFLRYSIFVNLSSMSKSSFANSSFKKVVHC